LIFFQIRLHFRFSFTLMTAAIFDGFLRHYISAAITLPHDFR
jgi:hypothetical protein